MQVPGHPADEQQRLAELHSLNILDTPAEERFDRITRIAKALFQVPIAQVSLVDSQRQWFKSCTGLPVTETSREVSYCGHAILYDDVFVIEDSHQDQRFNDNPMVLGSPHIRFYAGAQLTMPSGHTLGTLCLVDDVPRTFTQEQRSLLKDLAAIVIQELSAHQAATQDQLTRVLNRRGFELLAEKALASSRRYQWPCALIYMDLNDFKQVNDNHGHQAGDKALKAFAQLVAALTRESDIFARLSGDEFVVMMMNADHNRAEQKVSNIRQALTQWNGEKHLPFELSVSFGVVCYQPDHHQSLAELMHAGDQQMYRHKQTFRHKSA